MKGTSSPTSTASGHSNAAGKPGSVDFSLHIRTVYEPGGITRLGSLVREVAAGGTPRVMVVTDPGLAQTGHPQRALQAIREAGLEAFLFDQVQENPSTKVVDAGVRFAKEHRIEFLVAVGGGSSMDAAKGTNFLFTNGGQMSDYKGFGRATKPMLPSIGVPTTAGTGSEAQSYALITDESSHLKMACGDRKAAFRIALLDPELTVSQPQKVTAVTAIDAVAHALESYVCRKRNPFSNSFALAAWQHLEPNLEIVLREPKNIAARGAMQIGSHFAGMAIEQAMLGCCHSCANPLTAHYGITHGIAIGMMLPHVIRFNAVDVEDLYAELASAVGLAWPTGCASEALARRVEELVKAAGLPTRLQDCGVSKSILSLLAVEAAEQWTARFNPRAVDEADLHRLYEMAW